MSENQPEGTQQSKKGGGMLAGIVMLVLAALAGGGFLYYQSTTAQPEGGFVEIDTAQTQSAQTQTQANAAQTANDGQAAQDTAEPQAGQEEQQANALPNPLGIPAFMPEDVKPGNPVIAEVNGQKIERLEVFQFIQQMGPQVQQLPPQQAYPLALEQVVNAYVVQSEADKSGLETSPAFQEQLEESKRQILRAIYLQDQMAKTITPPMLEKRYEARIKDIPDTEERKARHILVETEDEAKEVIEKLKGGADFAMLAQEHSTGPSGQNGGDLGWFTRGDMVPEFSNAAFEGKKGEFRADPVQTQFGWHVIKIDDVRTKPKPTFEEMRSLILAELQREKLNELVISLREEADIKILDVNGEDPSAPKAEPEETAEQESEPAAEPAAGDDATSSAPETASE